MATKTKTEKQLKTIDFTKDTFKAMGITYNVKGSLSIERFRYFEKYQVEMGYGRTFEDVYKAVTNTINYINNKKEVEGHSVLWNLQEGLKRVIKEGKVHPALMICALFIVEKDEDLTKWDEQQAEAKIKNWNDEGYDVNGFFQLAANLVSGYINALEDIFQDTSKLAEAVEQLESLKKS